MNMSDEDFQNYEIQRKAKQAADKREYYKNNKERIKAMRKSCAERARTEMLYGVEDKEAFAKKYDEFIKKQNEEKKEKISEQGKIKVTCECGSSISRNYKSEHLKTIKHCNYIKNKIKMTKQMTCECGSTFLKYYKSEHLKSQKHCNYIKNKDT